MFSRNKTYDLYIKYQFNYDDLLITCKNQYNNILIPENVINAEQLTNSIIILAEAKMVLKLRKYIRKLIFKLGIIIKYKLEDSYMHYRFDVKDKYNDLALSKYPFIENELKHIYDICSNEIKQELSKEFNFKLPIKLKEIKYEIKQAF